MQGAGRIEGEENSEGVVVDCFPRISTGECRVEIGNEVEAWMTILVTNPHLFFVVYATRCRCWICQIDTMITTLNPDHPVTRAIRTSRTPR